MSDASQSLGGFTLIERIGKGGMGEVWRAERVGAGGVRKRAAVKRIAREFQKDPVLRARFLAEARTTARLEHPNIVQVIDFGEQPELFLVLEFIEGVSVADLLRQASLGIGPLPPAAAMYIVAEAATGLDYAHRKTDENGQPLNIVHRDISPPNILVSLDGAVKVGDFGIARAADNRVRTEAGVALGKIVYMAPEQSRGEVVDHRADVFALGVVLWELLALRPLIPRNNPAAATDFLAKGEIPTFASVGRSVPPGVEEIVREALARDPAKRTASANRMARSLRTALHAVAPGFDSRELSNVVRGLMPDLTFGAPTPAPLPARTTPEPQPVAPQPSRIAPTREMRYEPASSSAVTSGGHAAHRPHGAHVPHEPPATAFVPPGVPARASRSPLPWAIGGVVVAAALGIGGYFALSSDRATPAAPDAPNVLPLMQQTLTRELARGARECADRLGAGTIPGRAALDATYAPGGAATDLTVKVFTNDAERDGRISACVTARMRALAVTAPSQGVAVRDLVVSF